VRDWAGGMYVSYIELYIHTHIYIYIYRERERKREREIEICIYIHLYIECVAHECVLTEALVVCTQPFCLGSQTGPDTAGEPVAAEGALVVVGFV